MELDSKLRILADAAKYDASCASSGSRRARPENGIGNTESIGICHSYAPDGRCISLLKLLLTNYCIYDCKYCVNRVSSDTPRARFSVEEVVTLTIGFYKRNYIEGLFLSSGIIQSPDYTMEQLIQVARKLREEHRFGGYIHLKAAPGATPRLLEEAGRWCDRLSANIELPTPAGLVQLAPGKSHGEIEGTMKAIQTQRQEAKEERRPQFLPAGQGTQMIVGATPEPDSAVLAKSSQLYRDYRLKRVYYSAFSPFPNADPRLPAKRAPLMREHRLYEADWLMRFYGFDASELTTPEEPNLSLEQDPKLGWALRHREFFPVDVNKAPKEALLRVPGIGVRNTKRILRVRRLQRLRSEDLIRLGVRWNKARYFVKTLDPQPGVLQLDAPKLVEKARPPAQMTLFEALGQAASGQL